MSHKKYRTEDNCLNCGTDVIGKFCHECGQENIEVHENFFHLVGHTLGDFFHYDSKFLRTLKPLFFRPGFLTLQHWEGKRRFYVEPLRLFFFITIIMVIVSNAYYHKFEKQIQNERVVVTTTTDGRPASETDIKESKQAEERMLGAVDKTFDFLSVYLKYISFILLPLYALIFKILYYKRKVFYIDHLTYTMHVQSFVYVIVSILLLIPLFITPDARQWWSKVAALLTIIYMIISLRYLYKQSWLKTIVKSLIAGVYLVFTTSLFIFFIGVIIFFLSE